MLSVLVPTRNDEAELARMLPGLVQHAVSGAISDVIIIDQGSSDETKKVAEIAGCKWVDADQTNMVDVIDRARGSWLLVLEPGARPMGDWLEQVEAHINGGLSGAARFSLAHDPGAPWWRRLVPVGSGGRPFARAFLISRSQARALCKPGMALVDLPRGVAVRTLSAALMPPREPSKA